VSDKLIKIADALDNGGPPFYESSQGVDLELERAISDASDALRECSTQIATLTRDLAAASEELRIRESQADTDGKRFDTMMDTITELRTQLAAANATVAQLIQHGIIAKRTKQSATDDGPDYVVLVPMGNKVTPQHTPHICDHRCGEDGHHAWPSPTAAEAAREGKGNT
jgi:hypothetical protein